MRVKFGVQVALGLVLALCTTAPLEAQEQNWAEKMFNKTSHDFGVVARGSDASYRFRVKNIYTTPVHMSHVRMSCTCARVTSTQSTLQPGEETLIEVSMDTERHMHKKDSNLLVTFDQPSFLEVRIPVSAYIRTDVVLTPGSANFGSVEKGAGGERKIHIAFAGRGDWAIREVKAGSEYIKADVTEKSRALNPATGHTRVEYELAVTLNRDTPLGMLRDQITIVTNDTTNPYVPVLVECKVESDITVTPAILALGRLTPGQTTQKNVVLRGNRPFLIEKIECEKHDGAFRVRQPTDARNLHVLPITLTAPDEPGQFNEEFTITIAGRPEPLTFKASGEIIH